LTQASKNDETIGNIEIIVENQEGELDSKDTLISSPSKRALSSNLLKVTPPMLLCRSAKKKSQNFKTKNESLMRLKELEQRIFESEKN
jgi:hypothetical protein